MIRQLNRLVKLLEEQVELSKKMEKHLYDLTLPPNMKEWAKEIQDGKTTNA